MASVSCDRFNADILNRFPSIRIEVSNCRKIAGSSRWSQHAYKNASDVFGPTGTLDRVAAHARSLNYVANVLWRVKNHYDHVHVDFHPQGRGTPNCMGGSGDPPQSSRRALGSIHVEGNDVQLPTLKPGSEGPAVGAIQLLCNGLLEVYGTGWEKLEKDDDYGPKTEGVVKAYQRWQRLSADGVVGPVTWRRILGL